MQPQESVLELARRHVLEGERRVSEQEARIAELKEAGRDTELAETLLETFQETLVGMRDHLVYEETQAVPGGD
jgi:hypothetical protein